jgi:hypothetical protein
MSVSLNKDYIIRRAEAYVISEIENLKRKDKYSFCVKEGTKYWMLQVNVALTLDGVLDPNKIKWISFNDLKNYEGAPSTEEAFNAFVETLPKLVPDPEKKIETTNPGSAAKNLDPPLYESSAGLEDLQLALDQSSDLRWVKKINEDSHAPSLKSPSSALESVFKEKLPIYTIHGVKQENAAFQKVVGWIIFTQKLLKLENTVEKANMIQKFHIGEIINRCVSLLNHLPLEMIDPLAFRLGVEINLVAIQVLETMSMFYFFESMEWKKAVNSLQADSTKNKHFPLLMRAFEIILDQKDQKKICVSAWDTDTKQFLLARSGRMWGFDPQYLESWTTTRKICKSALANEPLFFTNIVAADITMEILFRITYVFSQFIDKNPTSMIFPKNINDFNTVRGHFAGLLWDLFSTRPNTENRIAILFRLYNVFNKALSPEKWDALLHLAEKETVSKQDILAIVMDGKITKEQTVAMFLSVYSCGELKIVLECCRLGFLSPTQRRDLPETLGKRLLFFAIRSKEKKQEQGKTIFIGKHEVIQMETCDKCRDIWPALEALYKVLRKTGINLQGLQQLDLLLAKAQRKKIET